MYPDLNSRVRRLGPPSHDGAPLVEVAKAIPLHHRDLDHHARSLCHNLASYLSLGEYNRAAMVLGELEAAIRSQAAAQAAPKTPPPSTLAELCSDYGIAIGEDLGRATYELANAHALAEQFLREPARRWSASFIRTLDATAPDVETRLLRFTQAGVTMPPVRTGSAFGTAKQLLADIVAEEGHTMGAARDDRQWLRAFAKSLGIVADDPQHVCAQTVGRLERAIRVCGASGQWLAVYWCRELRRYLVGGSLPVEGQPEVQLAIAAVHSLVFSREAQ